MLVSMIEALDERGPDSSGIALYSDDDQRRGFGTPRAAERSPWAATSRSTGARCSDVLVERFGAAVESAGLRRRDGGRRTRRTRGRRPDARGRDVARRSGCSATGRNLKVLKDTGRPTRHVPATAWPAGTGYLAVAHTRMATESAVTVLHSHPFVPSRDLCVVHNGSFSNYATVRRHLMAEGVRFDSDNDSEVAARYLARRLAAGDDLEEATRWVMKEMDGFFTLVISTADEMSVVRDAFACKPAVVAETAGYVAVASEYRALAELPGIAGPTSSSPNLRRSTRGAAEL